MVARITLGSPKLAEVHADALLLVRRRRFAAARFGRRAHRRRDRLRRGTPGAALPRATPAERAARTERLQAALPSGRSAAACRRIAADLLALCERAAATAQYASDERRRMRAPLGRAALEASAANVRINHRYLKDAATRRRANGALAHDAGNRGRHETRPASSYKNESRATARYTRSGFIVPNITIERLRRHHSRARTVAPDRLIRTRPLERRPLPRTSPTRPRPSNASSRAPLPRSAVAHAQLPRTGAILRRVAAHLREHKTAIARSGARNGQRSSRGKRNSKRAPAGPCEYYVRNQTRRQSAERGAAVAESF